MAEATFDIARAEHPTVDIDRESFEEYVAQRIEDGEAPHAADLYLACGCVHGDHAALSAFNERFGRIVDITIAKLRLGDLGQDVRQTLLERLLLMRGDRPPAIALYTGRGPLNAYLRVAVTREGLMLAGRYKREAPNTAELIERAASDDDPEARALKRKYGAIVKEAFQGALADLSKREQRLLRYHYLEDLTTRQIGTLLSVHSSTVTRRLAQTRGRLLSMARDRLARAVSSGGQDLEAICRLVESQLDLSLTRLLAKSSR